MAIHAHLRRDVATRFDFTLPRSMWWGYNAPHVVRFRAMRFDKYIKHSLAIRAVSADPVFATFVGLDAALASLEDH